MPDAKSASEEGLTRIVFWPIWKAARWLAMLFFLSVLSVIVSIAAWRYQVNVPLDGASVRMDARYMAVLVERSLEYSAYQPVSQVIARGNYALLFKATGIHSALLYGTENGLLSRLTRSFPIEIGVAMQASRLYGMRLGNVLMMIPLIILVVSLATLDGLVERAIRTASAGHESATRFRIARHYAYTLLPPLVGIVYLCLPLDWRPGDVLFPALAVSAVLIRTKWAYYKKHV